MGAELKNIMTAQQTKNTTFIEKRHNAENKRYKIISRIKRGLIYNLSYTWNVNGV